MHLLLPLSLHVALAVALLLVGMRTGGGSHAPCCTGARPARPAALTLLPFIVWVAVLALCPAPARPGSALFTFGKVLARKCQVSPASSLLMV